MVDLSLGTILAQMLNFFILVWLLARFAYKPLLAMMTERKERIAKDLEANKPVQRQKSLKLIMQLKFLMLV